MFKVLGRCFNRHKHQIPTYGWQPCTALRKLELPLASNQSGHFQQPLPPRSSATFRDLAYLKRRRRDRKHGNEAETPAQSRVLWQAEASRDRERPGWATDELPRPRKHCCSPAPCLRSCSCCRPQLTQFQPRTSQFSRRLHKHLQTGRQAGTQLNIFARICFISLSLQIAPVNADRFLITWLY